MATRRRTKRAAKPPKDRSRATTLAPAPMPPSPKDDAPDPLGVTPKQRRFVHEYLFDLNATQAAIRAGYSAKTAGSQAHDLLKKPEIKALVAYKQREQLDRTQMSAEALKEMLWRAAFPDLSRIYDSTGMLRPLHELSKADLAHISGVKLVKKNLETGDGVVDRVLEYKMPDPNKAREILAKHFGLLKDQLEISGGATFRWMRETEGEGADDDE